MSVSERLTKLASTAVADNERQKLTLQRARMWWEELRYAIALELGADVLAGVSDDPPQSMLGHDVRCRAGKPMDYVPSSPHRVVMNFPDAKAIVSAWRQTEDGQWESMNSFSRRRNQSRFIIEEEPLAPNEIRVCPVGFIVDGKEYETFALALSAALTK